MLSRRQGYGSNKEGFLQIQSTKEAFLKAISQSSRVASRRLFSISL